MVGENNTHREQTTQRETGGVMDIHFLFTEKLKSVIFSYSFLIILILIDAGLMSGN